MSAHDAMVFGVEQYLLECLRASRCGEEEKHAALIHDMIVGCLKICDRKYVPIALNV